MLDNDSEYNLEYSLQIDHSSKRIDHMLLIQDKLRNHISLLEMISQQLEQSLTITTDPQKKINIRKTISYNFDKIIKLYDIYQSYETTIQKYYSGQVDIINKKHRILLDSQKNKSLGAESTDFFRRMNEYFNQRPGSQIEKDISIEDPDLQL